jgi:molybdopterin-guanine dinucleotide biosynthesis adapter protein
VTDSATDSAVGRAPGTAKQSQTSKSSSPPVFGFAGYSGSGKTTLIERVIPLMVARGLRVSLIKHAHHSFDIDRPGKDSYRHREAGASEVLITSAQRWVLMHELRGEQEPSLSEQLPYLAPCDLILVEGYKREKIPKMEVHRSIVGKPLLHPLDANIVALACDSVRPEGAKDLPLLNLNDPEQIAVFILQHCGLIH